eukprot:ANDGO_02585.mRNA.1 Dynein light chain Tctex-type
MEDDLRPQVVKVYENTYRMSPVDGKRFSQAPVRSTVSAVLEEKLSKSRDYDASKAAGVCKEISRDVQHALKKLDLPNYKFVVQTTIGQLKGQGVRMASRCLWDKENDNSVSVTQKTPSMFVNVMVFGCYYE